MSVSENLSKRYNQLPVGLYGGRGSRDIHGPHDNCLHSPVQPDLKSASEKLSEGAHSGLTLKMASGKMLFESS